MLKLWTPKEDEALRLMIIAGRRPGEIAVELRRSLSAVRTRAYHLRLTFKLWSPKSRRG
jgi:DNA-directed RNA polymerase specialized sigma24 family protein